VASLIARGECYAVDRYTKEIAAMPDLGVPELIIIAVIVLLLFGPGKAADLGSSLGKSIREFRKATREDEPTSTTRAALPAAADGSAPSAPASGDRYCIECGARAAYGQRFCTSCGKPLAA
jgi:sec-independent protein translocase protein TatA